MKKESTRVAFFSCVYHEVDGVARTSRHFEAFAKRRELPLLMVHAGPRDIIATEGSVTNIELQRSPMKFPLDQAHEYDLLFWRHYRKLEPLVRNFRPHLIQITGPSDVGMLGALIAHRLGIPLAASWQTNRASVCAKSCRGGVVISLTTGDFQTTRCDRALRVFSAADAFLQDPATSLCAKPGNRAVARGGDGQALLHDVARRGYGYFQAGASQSARRPDSRSATWDGSRRRKACARSRGLKRLFWPWAIGTFVSWW